MSNLLKETYVLIREGRGSHFDPDMVDAFRSVADEFHTISEQFADEESFYRASRLMLRKSRSVFPAGRDPFSFLSVENP